ncbi:MAG: aminomethyl-transferring glycine dehydrogenase subunit GcvPA [Pygmaiobacter massiliensis]|nr:aminomethyl-transferring glycine dehydrogenase subunit GcvPA [Pygmaiobacter massiliensis]
MGTFVPGTGSEQLLMLHESGYADWDALFADVPAQVRLADGALDLPDGLSEMEAAAAMRALADKNHRFAHIFRGAGAYRHYIPAIVGRVTRKENFLTSYTPYQAEISQGILQSIFEYQSMICELTGMDVSNASVYDGAAATAEAAAMCTERKRNKVYLSQTLPPQVIQTVQTYCFGSNTPVQLVPEKDGVTDLDALKDLLDDTAACVIMAQPNYYGQIEDAAAIGKLAHEAGAKLVMNCNPISLGLLATPAECGADVAVGEGQPLGMPLAWGGPYLGYMAATTAMMRKLPGRIVGETTDNAGNRAFVLTLQAREQHIRREKAKSNVCSNEALCALTAGVYLSAVGPDGLAQIAQRCCDNAHYLASQLEKAGLKLAFSNEFFHEFVTECPDAVAVLDALAEQDILGGLPLDEHRILWCATECNTKEEMDQVAQIAKEVCGQ